MEEAEALSSKLAIMVEGQIKCIGPVQRLKSKYGQGFEIEVKVKLPSEQESKELRAKLTSKIVDDKVSTKEQAIEVLKELGYANPEFEFNTNGLCNHFNTQVKYAIIIA